MPEIIFPVPAGNHLLASELHRQIIVEAASSGIKIFVVGGYLRDLILNSVNPQYKLVSKDLDYATVGGSAFDFAKKIAAKLAGHFVALDQENDTARVVLSNGYIFDFAGCLGNSLEKDLHRRDFTINALYLDPDRANNIIDLGTGISDIKSGIVRAIDASVLVDDPLRNLRAFRFAATLNFDIEPQTYNWIKDNTTLINKVAGERISSELFTIFAVRSSKTVLQKFAQSGLMEEVFPELKATREVTNNAYHHLNLFDHSLEAVLQLEQELAAQPIWLQTNLEEEVSSGVSRLSICKIACLLHDIGKPATWIVTDEGKHTFIGHERLGAEMAMSIAGRLRWSKQIDRLVSKLIRLHLRPGQLFHQQEPSIKALNRFYRQVGDEVPQLLLLAFGDLSATRGLLMTTEKFEYLRKNFYALLSGFYEYRTSTKEMKNLLDGHDVMKLLNLKASKEIGQILLALKEAQESKEVKNKEEAEKYILSFYKNKKKL